MAKWLGTTRSFHATCASTNDLAAEAGRAGSTEGLVVWADSQTGGRGRMGRVWHSPPGRNLYFSCLLRPRVPLTVLPPLALVVAVGLGRALEAMGVPVDLKWPNDILVRGKKLAGVLIEAALSGEKTSQVVVGVGLNVNLDAADLPPEICATATSLKIERGQPFDLEPTLTALLDSLETVYEHYVAHGPAAAIAEFVTRSSMFGAPVNVERPGGAGAIATGIAEGLSPDGELEVRDAAGKLHRLSSGEVSVRATVTGRR